MATKLPPSIEELIARLSRLPSLGPRQATRLAFHLATSGAENAKNLARAIGALARVKICERCFFAHEENGALCGICSDPKRQQGTIMIAEKETDLASIENTGKFRGRYLVIGPLPKTGALTEWQKLRLESLKGFIQKELNGAAEEIIIATNPTSFGDLQAASLRKELQQYAKKISRLGRGLPWGGEIEFADEETLRSALEGRL